MTDDFAARLRDAVHAAPVHSTLEPDTVLRRSLHARTRRAFGTAGIAVAACAVVGTAIAAPGGVFDRTVESAPASAALDGDVLRVGEAPVLVDIDGVTATDKAVGSELSDGTIVLDLGLASWAGVDERFVATFQADEHYPTVEIWSTDNVGLDTLYSRGQADGPGTADMTRVADNQGAFVVVANPDQTQSVVIGAFEPTEEIGLVPWKGDETTLLPTDTTLPITDLSASYAEIFDAVPVIPTVRDPLNFYDVSIIAADVGRTPLYAAISVNNTGYDDSTFAGYSCDGPCTAAILADDGTVTRPEAPGRTVLASALWTQDLTEQSTRVTAPSTHGVSLEARCNAPVGVDLEVVVLVDGVESSRIPLPCMGGLTEVALDDLRGDVSVELAGDVDAATSAAARLFG